MEAALANLLEKSSTFFLYMQNGEPHDMHAPAGGVHGDGATYPITLATAGALGSWQTPVSLLSGLTGGSDKTD